MTIKLKVYTLTTDTDNGTETEVFVTREAAEEAYIDLVDHEVRAHNQWRFPEEDLKIPTTFEEAEEAYDQLIDNGFIDTYVLDEQVLELSPTPPEPKLQRFYVTLTWEDWPNCGSYGTVVWAEDYDDAEAKGRMEMLVDVREDPDCSYQNDWHVVDCFPLDDFISRSLG